MTFAAPHRQAFQRGVLAAVVIADLLSFFMFLGEARASALAQGSVLSGFVDLFTRPVPSGLVIVIGVAGAALFARRAGQLWAGLLPLGALTLLSTVHAQAFGSPWRHLYYSGLCLSGWLVGLAVSRWRGQPTDESYACIGSTALLGAAYFNAGISKLVFGGWDWVLGLPIQAVVVAQDGMVSGSIVDAYRSWVVATPAVAAVFSVATLLFEIAGPLLIAGRAIRVCVALGLLAMHLNILVLTHILYWEAMVFLVLFGLFPSAARGETVPQSAPTIGFRGPGFGVAVALLVICGLTGIGHQTRRFARWQEASMAPRESFAAAAAPSPPGAGEAPTARSEASRIPAVPADAAPLQLGPFTVGQTLAEGWSIDALEITDEGFIAVLAGRPGRARFEVTCSPSQQRSPFDLEAAHIFYSRDVDFHDLEAVGWAFREHIRVAGGGPALCDTMAAWRTAARAGQPR